MTISAKVIAHSRSPFHNHGVKDITTFLLRYPRFIHAEVMTHRVFSRNSSSSRAIPVERLIADVLADTAMPIHWGRNQKGMQADHENDALIYHDSVSPLDMLDNTFEGVTSKDAWLKARDKMVAIAGAFDAAGYHKQIVNRLLEPFCHINLVVTATDFDNFYWLRRHKDAQPEIKALADRMYEAHVASTPRLLRADEWHLPFVTDADRETVISGYRYLGHGDYETDDMPISTAELLRVSTARCARTSYMTHDGRTPNLSEDIALFDRLVGSTPLHASPTEHQARPDEPVFGTYGNVEFFGQSGNFDAGWIQHRKLLPYEHITDYEAATAELGEMGVFV